MQVLAAILVTNKDLLYCTGNSAHCYVSGWMGGEFGGEWIHLYVWLSHFAVHLKLLQRCSSATLQYKIKCLKNKKMGGGRGVQDGEHMYTHGRFMAKPIQYCKVIGLQLK